MKRKVLVLILAVGCVITSASAQHKWKLQVGYNVSIPQGSFKSEFIDKTSFRGAAGEISYAINPKFSVGLHTGYQSYYQKYDRAVYKLSNTEDISAVVTNSLDIMPAILKGTFYPLGSSATAKVQPYISAGAGINLVTYRQYLGEFGGTQANTPFAAQGGAGVVIPFGKRSNQTGISLGGTYNLVNYGNYGISKLNNIGVNAGVVFPLK